jgi:hypothetical protein
MATLSARRARHHGARGIGATASWSRRCRQGNLIDALYALAPLP